MADNETFDPIASEAGQDRIVQAIKQISSLEYAVRAEQAATQAAQDKNEAAQSAQDAKDAADRAEQAATSIVIDTTITENGANPVTGGAIYTALSGKADSTNVYTKTDVYTKTETDSAINTRLAELVASAPATLDTLDELANALGDDPNFATTIATQLGNKADKSTTYTKTEVDTLLADKADSDDVQTLLTFDDTPTANSDNPVKSGGVYTALQNLPSGTGDVTTNTNQNITGTKTFVGSKKVAFKQSAANDKLGFTLYGNTGTERGYLEFNPTNTVDGVAGLMTLGNYATSAASLTQVGFRRYSNISGESGAYNLLMPMVADARTPFSLTTSYQNFYLPLGVTDGTTMVKTDKGGVIDISPLLPSSGGESVTVDTEITETSTNPVTSAAIYAALQNIPSGGGSGGGSLTCDTLYESTTGFSTGTITLSESLLDYDFIEFILGDGTDLRKYNTNRIYSKQMLQDVVGKSDKYIFFASYQGGWQMCSIDSTGKQISCSNRNGGTLLFEVIGYKSGSGSSVTVDTEITETSQNPVVSQAIYNALRRVSNGERFPYDDSFEQMIPSDMITRYANSVLYAQNGRTYYKKNDGIAAGCISVIANHTRVMLVSDSPDSVIEYCSYDVDSLSTATSIIVDGKTYYYATAPTPWEMNTRNVENSAVRIISNTFNDEQSAALYIINNLLEKPSPNRTLAEYKIADAYTKTEVDALLSSLEQRIAALEGN